MPEPAYVKIAGDLTRQIRSGELPPGIQLPSLSEIARRHGVSEIVARKAMELMQAQGLVRSEPRRGNFVAERPNLVRVSPERQMETAETTFRHESDAEPDVERQSEDVPATTELAVAFGIAVGDTCSHVVTRASERGRPISISDTYQPSDIVGVDTAAECEEKLADRLPAPSHAEWLRTTPGDLVKTIHQKFWNTDGRLIMVSDISYPMDRYDAFVFRMVLKRPTSHGNGE
jgi:GntR family transcriptional regulator